jgi:predicted alpha/beta superfamily hydrolase
MGIYGRLERESKFLSRYIPERIVDVWLPAGYALHNERRHPVIYMHDGQNLFDPETASYGVDWGIDEAVYRLLGTGRIRDPIVVGIWSLDAARWREYMPRKALDLPAAAPQRAHFIEQGGGEPQSDDYLLMIVKELKPFVDRWYRTLPERENTFIMGSSMGGLISLYALCEYPEVFAGAGCLSTHWPAGDGIVIDYLQQALPPPGAHRLYFDHGTETLDAEYKPYQRQADEVMRAAGYEHGVDWLSLEFPGAEHSEQSWRERVHIPLIFLLEGRVEV